MATCIPTIEEEQKKEDLDEDGYPTDHALDIIKSWPYDDIKGLFNYIESLWKWPEYIHKYTLTDKSLVYRLATGGWSGNESIIGALQENTMVWLKTWFSSTRGGLFEFDIKE